MSKDRVYFVKVFVDRLTKRHLQMLNPKIAKNVHRIHEAASIPRSSILDSA